MKIRDGLKVLVLGVSGVLGGLTLAAQPILASEYIVKLKAKTSFKEAFTKFNSEKSSDVKILDTHPTGALVKITVSDENKTTKAQTLTKLFKSADVQYVVPNIRFHAVGTPNDPSFSQQWGLTKINAPAAWDITAGSRQTVVAVIDTGVDVKHPDLVDNIWQNRSEIAGNGVDDDNNGYVDDVNGWDFHDEDADPMDITGTQNPGHGTHCAGILGGRGNNGIGISGSSQVVSIMALRFLGSDGSGDLMAGAKAIDYAAANGAAIISASWGARTDATEAQPVSEAIERAAQKGVIFIAAAGNDGVSNDSVEFYPANTVASNMISVAASGSGDAKPSWSNYGLAKISVAAPGEDIYSTLPNNTYGKLSGTSMATPMVSGVVALLKSQRPDLDAATVKAILQSTGTSVSIQTACNCRIDAAAAASAIEDHDLVVVPNALTLPPAATQQFSGFGGASGQRQFESTNPAVATIDSNGLLTAVALGETTVKVTDVTGLAAESQKIRVADPAAPDPGGDCPLGDEVMCEFMCLLDPTLPWCAE